MAPAADLTHHQPKSKIPPRSYSQHKPPSLIEFQKLCAKTCSKADYPLATEVTSNIPIYDLSSHHANDLDLVNQLQDEWHSILLSGPGVLVLKSFTPDTPSLIDRINSVFSIIIDSEANLASFSAPKKGDHFAASGKNARIWNSFQKHAFIDPASFLPYYANPWLSHICTTWLGPAYQLTAQVNIVKPGGQPQTPHRDYHLGFQTAASCALYPKTTHLATQHLTLQGGIAHTDIPLSSGPTRFLPFSQAFAEGYMAYRLPQFQEHFAAHWVSLPLSKGDAVFFNPALFHAAGENTTADVERSVNLLQVSSAFGRAMEQVDTLAVIESCFDELRAMFEREGMMSLRVQAAVAAVAEGYPFPTNLDRRPPAPGGMAPQSEAEALMGGLEGGLGKEEVMRLLREIRESALP